jgi:hypothetical protein
MNELEKYQAVNFTKSLKELADVILSFADKEGLIEGRMSTFDAKRMADRCHMFDSYLPNVLTRRWGIRQQAMMLSFNQRNKIS